MLQNKNLNNLSKANNDTKLNKTKNNKSGKKDSKASIKQPNPEQIIVNAESNNELIDLQQKLANLNGKIFILKTTIKDINTYNAEKSPYFHIFIPIIIEHKDSYKFMKLITGSDNNDSNDTYSHDGNKTYSPVIIYDQKYNQNEYDDASFKDSFDVLYSSNNSTPTITFESQPQHNVQVDFNDPHAFRLVVKPKFDVIVKDGIDTNIEYTFKNETPYFMYILGLKFDENNKIINTPKRIICIFYTDIDSYTNSDIDSYTNYTIDEQSYDHSNFISMKYNGISYKYITTTIDSDTFNDQYTVVMSTYSDIYYYADITTYYPKKTKYESTGKLPDVTKSTSSHHDINTPYINTYKNNGGKTRRKPRRQLRRKLTRKSSRKIRRNRK